MATSALTGQVVVVRVRRSCTSGASAISRLRHQFFSPCYGLPSSALPIKLGLKPLNSFHIALGPISEDSPTDSDRLRSLQSAGGEPAFECGSVNSDKGANLQRA